MTRSSIRHYFKKNAYVFLYSLSVILFFMTSADGVAQLEETPADAFEYRIEGTRATITKFIGNQTEVIIPANLGGMPVAVIAESAFAFCEDMTSVIIPQSVTSIGREAFSGCSSLTAISIPDGVTSIEDGAFLECIGLESVVLPNKLKSIGGKRMYIMNIIKAGGDMVERPKSFFGKRIIVFQWMINEDGMANQYLKKLLLL